MNRPSLTFFCELESQALVDLFHDGTVIDFLKRIDANLSLGLLDLSKQRADVVKKLNHAGVPVTAWLLLPAEQGYWTSLDTIQETVQRYSEFETWKNKYKLSFAAVGLDIEPKIGTMGALSKRPLNQVFPLVRRFIFGNNFKDAEIEARALLQNIRADGYAVETYQFPTVIDERAARSNVLAKTLGIPPLPADREVLMLYSSFFPVHADSILWSYAKEAKAVGVGSTGGGVEIEGVPPLKTLRWINLKRDLLLASKAVDHLYIFSLEGCVEQRFLDRLISLDWDTDALPPERPAAGISLVRKVGQGILWSLSHPFETFFFTILITRFFKGLSGLLSRKK